MRASKNSGPSPLSKTRSFKPLVLAAAAFALLSAAAILFVQVQGTALYYGDAMAHLNIARRIVDGRTLGYHQVGTVWLPLPHLLMLPFVGDNSFWQSGLAGAIPAGLCFVLAGTFLFALLRRLFGLRSAIVGSACLAGNLNLLYLQSTPMTESLFFASALGLLLATVRFAESRSPLDAALAGVAAICGTMTRYEGWFFLPFVALYFLLRGGWRPALLFSCVAGLGPLYWLAHNAVMYSDPLEFYRGLGSALDIAKQGKFSHPGDHNWPVAIRQFLTAAKAVNGWPLAVAGGLGCVIALFSKAYWPVFFLCLSPIFYVMSLHSGGTPIFIPEIYPFSYYNTRYALAALPLLCLGAAALAQRLGRFSSLLLPLSLVWFLFSPVLCFQEATVNSKSRRTWTKEVAELLRSEYRPGQGILMPFGDLTGILTEAGIPIAESIHQGDLVLYESMLKRPDLFLRCDWVIALSADPASYAMAQRPREQWQCVKLILTPYSRVVEVWRRVRTP